MKDSGVRARDVRYLAHLYPDTRRQKICYWAQRLDLAGTFSVKVEPGPAYYQNRPLQGSPVSIRARNSVEKSASSPNAIACRILLIMSRKNATLWWEFRIDAKISLA